MISFISLNVAMHVNNQVWCNLVYMHACAELEHVHCMYKIIHVASVELSSTTSHYKNIVPMAK